MIDKILAFFGLVRHSIHLELKVLADRHSSEINKLKVLVADTRARMGWRNEDVLINEIKEVTPLTAPNTK